MSRFAVPEELVEQFATGNAVLFLGSELVATTEDGEPMPRWDDIARLLAERCGYSDENLSLPRVAQHFEMVKGRQALVDFLVERLDDPRLVPAPTHHLIARLPFPIIITTAMDLLLERALRQAGRRVQKVVTSADAAYLDAEATVVIKLLGDVERKEAIVITEDDYLAYADRSPLLSDMVKAHFATTTPLFLHCDLDDPHLKQIYDEVVRRQGRHKARGFAVHPTPTDYQRRFWARKNLEIIVADPVAFLQALHHELTERAPAAPPKERPPIAPGRRPYKFLDYYEARDADLFYGRETEIRQLVPKILSHRLTVLVGQSGTGKTSLLLAGVKPELERHACAVVYVRLLDDSVESLLGAVRATLELELPAAPLLDALETVEDTLSGPLVLILDQFEEFFVGFGAQSQQRFIEELGRCLRSRLVGTRFVLALRDDFFVHLHEFQPQVPGVFNNTFELHRLTPQQAVAAITRPLEHFDMTVEEALVEQLVADLDQEGVDPPQLQIVCDGLYDHALARGSKTLTLADYQALGYPVDAAVSEARRGVYIDHGAALRDRGVPVVLMRAGEGILFKREG